LAKTIRALSNEIRKDAEHAKDPITGEALELFTNACRFFVM
jgi:hypothetical protein